MAKAQRNKPAEKKPAEKKQKVAAGSNYSEAHETNVVVHKKDESQPAEKTE